jgi:hypothetical protein
MSTTLPADPRPFRRRWADFWFAPTDPTTLGFIRVVTGLLILYTHMTYSLDLQVFFGKTGWYSAQKIEDERKRFPWVVGSLTDWDERTDTVRVPEYPHRRKAVMDFLDRLAEDDAARAATADYVNRVNRYIDFQAASTFNLLINLTEAPKDQDRLLTGLAEGRQFYIVLAEVDPHTRERRVEFLATPPRPDDPNPNQLFPSFMLALSKEDREALARDAREMLRVLPKVSAGERQYAIIHMMELDLYSRMALVKFLRSLDPETPAERKRVLRDLRDWSTDPRKAIRTGHPVFSPWFHVTDPTQMGAIHAGVLVVFFLFTIGFCTRVTSVLTWIAAVGYIHRTQQVLFGMDTMMNILIIYLMIGNSGAALSVDRLVARYRAARASLRRSGTIDDATRAFLAAPPPSASAGFAIRLFQVHFCFIYLAAGFAKLKGAGWWNGNAFWDVMVNPEFTLLRYHWFEDFVRFTASIKPVYYFITATGVWFTWGLEIVFPFLIWTRLRPVMLWLAVILHASIGVLMGLNLFELMMMTMLLVFLPPGVIRDRLRGGPGLPGAAVTFDPADERSARAAAAAVAADVDAQLTLEPRKGAATTVTADGVSASGPAAVAALFARLRLLRAVRWVLWVPGVAALLARRLFPTKGNGGPPPSNGTGAMKTPAAAS